MLALILTASEANGGQQRNGAGFRCEIGTEDFWAVAGAPGALLETPRPIEGVWESGDGCVELSGRLLHFICFIKNDDYSSDSLI